MPFRSTQKNSSLLTGIDEPRHAVQFYDEDSFLVESVARFLGQSLSAGGPAIVVATREHRDAFAEELQLRGIDVVEATSQGRYIALDAADTLSRFMVEGFPDREHFNYTITNVVARLKAAGAEAPLPTIFGEMVALLWA